MNRLLLDEDIHKSSAEQLRLRGYDAIHVVELSRGGFSDEEQLLFAHRESRILVSFNVRDFVRLHESFILSKRSHSGIILSKQIPIGEFIKKLAIELERQEAFEDLICFM